MMATTAMQLALILDRYLIMQVELLKWANCPKEVEHYRYLDSVGNTTAATGKVAIASAALTSLALFALRNFYRNWRNQYFKAPVLAMLFVGGMIPVVLGISHEFSGESSYGYGVRSTSSV
jgi:K(+)-stimulated pyrophosphate-energized sodium pump